MSNCEDLLFVELELNIGKKTQKLLQLLKKTTKDIVKKPEEKSAQDYKETINAVLDGTFYLSSGADQPPFVEEGT